MTKKRDVIKRNIIDIDERLPEDFNRAIRENAQDPECVEIPIAYCDRWECFTRFLCREKAPDNNSHNEPTGETP